MERNEALQHGLGYAAGREDTSNTATKLSADPNNFWQSSGYVAFAEAYADGWDAYNTQKRHWMTNARDAYDTWQASSGQTIFSDEWREIQHADDAELQRIESSACDH